MDLKMDNVRKQIDIPTSDTHSNMIKITRNFIIEEVLEQGSEKLGNQMFLNLII